MPASICDDAPARMRPAAGPLWAPLGGLFDLSEVIAPRPPAAHRLTSHQILAGGLRIASAARARYDAPLGIVIVSWDDIKTDEFSPVRACCRSSGSACLHARALRRTHHRPAACVCIHALLLRPTGAPVDAAIERNAHGDVERPRVLARLNDDSQRVGRRCVTTNGAARKGG
jgi:hypothetical protein